MKGLIVYRSKYGAAEKYARWLSERTGFPCKDVTEARARDLDMADTIIFGSGIYASGVAAISYVKNNTRKLWGKRVFVYGCGASPYDEKQIEAIRARSFRGPLSEIPFFYMRGAWNMEKMSVLDRFLCQKLQKAVAKKDPASMEVWEKALLEAGAKSCDWTDPKYLEPLLDAIGRE